MSDTQKRPAKICFAYLTFLLDSAKTIKDFETAQFAIDPITTEIQSHLSRSPFIFRKTGQSPFLRELVISFRSFGYVVLYDIEDRATINILAVRPQLEDDYH